MRIFIISLASLIASLWTIKHFFPIETENAKRARRFDEFSERIRLENEIRVKTMPQRPPSRGYPLPPQKPVPFSK